MVAEGCASLGVATSTPVAAAEVGAVSVTVGAVLAHLAGGGFAYSSCFTSMYCTPQPVTGCCKGKTAGTSESYLEQL